MLRGQEARTLVGLFFLPSVTHFSQWVSLIHKLVPYSDTLMSCGNLTEKQCVHCLPFQQEHIRYISSGTSSTASCITQETQLLTSGPFVYIWARLDENALQFMHLY